MSTILQQTLTIPDEMIPYLSDQLNLDDIICCPVIVRKDSHHLHFHTPRISKYQESRVIVLVQHIQSLVILSLAVSYGYFVGDTSSWWAQVVWNVVSGVKILRKPDNEDYLPGKLHCLSFEYR
ncbi:hypothetical protein DICSQDRAFT_166243 [Dichomitus squalens LYAD-421 SS1]|uniref:uncharacterized protein n=1 Tax=Dichomitus squalens (strain LYAD-421) TaxID=732165 RepID=UPI00044122CD|nr:uncharacterized protein DICSQDRAFT_166243 [Dichomitus squalens LYAD-421 SS1]EJF65191.1 hypothetical protein DICSQDRAFT_166243 [Dichomitus squalens LYAD-421 SS1]